MPIQRLYAFQLADKTLDLVLVVLNDGPLVRSQRHLFQVPTDRGPALQGLPLCTGLGQVKSQPMQAIRCAQVLQNGLVQYELPRS